MSATLGSAPLSAQSPGILPQATHLPASTRAMALGDSYAMGSGHADAVFYHPGLIARASGFGLDVQRWSAESSAVAASAAMGWLGGSVAIGLRAMQYGSTLAGLQTLSTQDPLFQLSATPVSERIATVGYGRDGIMGFDIGVAVDLADVRVGPDLHNVALLDVGIAREVGPFVVGLTLQDLGEKPILDAGDAPARYTLGVGQYGRPVGPLDVGFAAHLGLDHEEEVRWGGGVEVGYWPIQGRTFVARLGVQDVPDGSDASPVTAGFAFWGDDITVEWAFRPFSDADNGGTHRF
ncbi:MAG: hypothetical protein R3253_13975, partial [Longimicrobiales bacterium]|nr:hypothetical protein [Longimicrobiales bacterium]